MHQPLQIAFITDGNAIKPTLVALFSALEQTSGAVRVMLVGLDLSGSDWDMARRIVARFPDATLAEMPFDPVLVAGAARTAAHISRATYARLFLHRMARGRVLYLDGDILVTGDLAPLARLDLGEKPAAAVCDYVVGRWAALAKVSTARRDRFAARLHRIAAITAPAPPATYVNAGVMLFDMDRIADDPDLTLRVEDVVAAGLCPLADQDHLNAVFAGQILPLAPEWNCSWGRLGRQRRNLARAGITTAGPTARGPVVLHFHGPRKPWHSLQWSMLAKGGAAVWRYRRERVRIRALFPDL